MTWRLVAVPVVVFLMVAGPAAARTTATLSYPLGEVWPAAVRFIRVDRGYVIREKDDKSGYVMFEIVEGQRTYKAALELIKTTDPEGRDATAVAFVIPDLPRHYETMLSDKLSAKIREERGSPAPPPPPPAAKKPVPAEDVDKDREKKDPEEGKTPTPPTAKDFPRAGTAQP